MSYLLGLFEAVDSGDLLAFEKCSSFLLLFAENL